MTPHAVLVPGFWLGGWAWDAVEPLLHDSDIATHPVTLPGLDGRRGAGVTLDHHIEGMDDAALERFRRHAVDEPVGVASAKIRVTDERRRDVPASAICTSIDSETLQAMIGSGDMPSELCSVHDVSFVELPTGHWPMFSRPADLAAVLRDEIRR